MIERVVEVTGDLKSIWKLEISDFGEQQKRQALVAQYIVPEALESLSQGKPSLSRTQSRRNPLPGQRFIGFFADDLELGDEDPVES